MQTAFFQLRALVSRPQSDDPLGANAWPVAPKPRTTSLDCTCTDAVQQTSQRVKVAVGVQRGGA